jgi:NCAIR mutase (PurE)-related protein
MKMKDIKKILQNIKNGNITVEEATQMLKDLPFSDLGEVKIDFHRSLRKGVPEAIFAQGKSVTQIRRIVEKMSGKEMAVVTKANRNIYEKLKDLDDVTYYDKCKIILIGKKKKATQKNYILVVSAGTSDIPVAEEAAVIAEIMGNKVERLYDVGVAGLHRLLNYWTLLSHARVIIATAGMDGVLPGIISGLVAAPVIALPTSIGYGTGMDGLAAILTMLNSCSPGLAVVNIDNGYGAGIFAHLINNIGGK